MEAKVHIHLHATDLEASKAFYEKFLGVPPVKEKPGYVKFLPEFAPLNIALSQGTPLNSRQPMVSHAGIQVDTTAQVEAQLKRVQAAGLPVQVEMGVDCCYANQDKFWVTDPDGLMWEVYHLNYDVEEELPRIRGRAILPMAGQAACCVPSAAVGLTQVAEAAR